MIRIILALILLICVTGCVVPPSGSPRVSMVNEYFKYSITQPGENLATISSWYCGDGELWTRFFIAANRDTKTLRPGDAVLIPSYLVKRTDPIDAAFIESNRSYPRKSSGPQKLNPTDESDNGAQPTEKTEKESDKSVQQEFLNTLSNPANNPS